MAFTPLNSNPDFSTNLSGWTAFGCSIARVDVSSDAPPVGDTWAMEITPDGSTNEPEAYTTPAVDENTEYFYRLCLKASFDLQVALRFWWYDSGSSFISTETHYLDVAADEWYVWEGYVTSPADAAEVDLSPGLDGIPDTSEIVTVAYAAIGNVWTQGTATAAIEASASMDGVGGHVAEDGITASATVAGAKAVSADTSAAAAASATMAGAKAATGAPSAGIEASTALSGTKAASGAVAAPGAMTVTATAEGRNRSNPVTYSDAPPLRARVRVYEPDGALRGQLPLPLGWQVAWPLNELASMELEYLNDAPGSEILAPPCEVVLELADADDVFREYPDCRFLNIRQSQNTLEPGVPIRLTMPSYGWMLRKVRNINTTAFDTEGKRVFTDHTVGSIIDTFINEAHERGNTPLLTTDFNAFTDSDGQAWTDTLTIEVPAGQDLFTLLTTLSAQGKCDWRMKRRALQLYKPDTFLNRDLTDDPDAVVLHTSRDVTTAPDDISYEDIAHTILVQGDDATFVTVEQDINPSPWGEWETFMTQSGVSDEAVMEDLALRALSTANAARTQLTRELMFRTQSPLPQLHYRPGDVVLGTDESTAYDDLRVRQITVRMSGQELTGNVVLGDRFTERDIRVQRQLAALTGAAATIGGSGTVPETPATSFEDGLIPAQVEGVDLTSSTFVDTLGRPRGRFTVQWNAVVESTSGFTMGIQSYRVRYAVQGSGNWQQVTVDGTQQIAYVGQDIQPVTTYTVQVAAVGTNGKQGAWSASADIFVQQDTEAPSVPSDPVVSARLGTLRVHWDGLDADGLAMPADLDHVQVEMASTASGPWDLIGTVPSSTADLVVAGQPYNETRYFRLRAVDTSGNTSGYSGTASGAVTPLVDADIIGAIIDGAKITDGTVVASDKIVAESITGGLIQALAISADHIQANAITADKIKAGAVTAEKVAAYSIDATRIAVGGSRNLVVDPHALDAELGAYRVANATGLPNSATGLTWSHDTAAGLYRVVPAVAAESMVGRIGWFAGTLLDPDLASGSGQTNPLYAYPVDEDLGGLVGRFQVNVSLAAGSWPGSSSVAVRLYARWVMSDGTLSMVSTVVPTVEYTDVTGDWVTLTTANPVPVPSGAVAAIPYVRVEFVNADTDMQVDLSSVFLAQASDGVLIEDGSITADKITSGAVTAAKIDSNAITTDKLSANAITSKHTITGSVIQTASSGHRVVISPNANYLGQPGLRLYTTGPGARDTNIFVAETDEGGWEQYSFAIVGPEAERNSSGRTDLNFKVGGGFYVRKAHVTDARMAGIIASTGGNEFGIWGSMPRGNFLGDSYSMIRGITDSDQNGSITWAFDNGYLYRGAICPNSPSTTPRFGSIRTTSSSSITWNCNDTVDQVYLFLFRGGYLL